jgi:hypothetical protein
MKSVSLHDIPHLSIHMQALLQNKLESRQTLITRTYIPFIKECYYSICDDDIIINDKLVIMLKLYTYINRHNVIQVIKLTHDNYHLNMILKFTRNLLNWLNRSSSLVIVKMDKNFYACKQMTTHILK